MRVKIPILYVANYRLCVYASSLLSSGAAPLLKLFLSNCVHFSCCSIASASAAAPKLHLLVITHMQHSTTLQWINKYVLLHEWEDSTGEHLVQGWQYWSDCREGQNRTECSPVLPDLRSAILYLAYDLALASSVNGLDSS